MFIYRTGDSGVGLIWIWKCGVKDFFPQTNREKIKAFASLAFVNPRPEKGVIFFLYVRFLTRLIISRPWTARVGKTFKNFPAARENKNYDNIRLEEGYYAIWMEIWRCDMAVLKRSLDAD